MKLIETVKAMDKKILAKRAGIVAGTVTAITVAGVAIYKLGDVKGFAEIATDVAEATVEVAEEVVAAV